MIKRMSPPRQSQETKVNFAQERWYSCSQKLLCYFVFQPVDFESSVLGLSAVDRGFESRSGQTKENEMGICCSSTKHAALRRKSKNWLARNQNNVAEWSDMSIRGLLFQCACTIKIQFSLLVEYKADLIIISLKINLFPP